MTYQISTNSIAQPIVLVDPATGEPYEAGTGGLPAGAATSAKQDTQITAEQAMQATLGATNGAAVSTDANGTIQQYLRGLVVLFVNFLTRLPAALGVGGGLKTEGVEASAAAITSNPVGVGGRVSSTNPSQLTTGQRINTWLSARGSTMVSFGAITSAADGTSNAQMAQMLDAGGDSVVYMPTFPHVFNGTSWDRLRGTTAGLLTLPGGNSFAHISTATTTVVKSGAGVLHTLSVNNLGTVASVTTIYDNTAGSGTVIAVINTLAGQTSYIYDVAFATGLTIVTTGTVAPDITVSYR